MNIKAESVNGNLVVTDLDANKVLDGVVGIQVGIDSDNKACLGLWYTDFSLAGSVGPQKNADGNTPTPAAK